MRGFHFWWICLAVVAVLGIGCDNSKDKDNNSDRPNGEVIDKDNDGTPLNQDCDDDDELIHPGAAEICDGVDNDCDAEIDEDTGDPWYDDFDGDGFGNIDRFILSCDPVAGRVDNGDDCNDADIDINPAAAEDCGPEDRNCDGDPVLNASDFNTYYADDDADGFGDDYDTITGCAPLPGYVGQPGDCDDADFNVKPTGEEICNSIDDDCDGQIDESDATDAPAWYTDYDGDGFGDAGVVVFACQQPSGLVPDGTDCDDFNALINPGAVDECNGGVDDDCNPVTYEDDVSGEDWFVDADGDGAGDAAGPVVNACVQPSGLVPDGDDCDDTNPDMFPGAPELCNGISDDCDGDIDEDPDDVAATWYLDNDGDGFAGIAATFVVQCSPPPNGVLTNDDCDDDDPNIYPGAPELCNGDIDDDCDAFTLDNDSPTAPLWYADADGDGYGDPADVQQVCLQPTGYIVDDTDCDDIVAAINPGEPEVCNGGIDDDCDPLTDEEIVDGFTWYPDLDGDGHGVTAGAVTACNQPSSTSLLDDDCDDADPLRAPSFTEICNGIDDNCDLVVDEDTASDAQAWYLDNDGDGFGDPAVFVVQCAQPSNSVADNTDCDDFAAAVNPIALEICNGDIDDDCDPFTVDDDDPAAPLWYLDTDGDGYGDDLTQVQQCLPPTGYVGLGGDCDEADGAANPGASEICNGGIDDDCDPLTLEDDVDGTPWFADVDGDGFGDLAVPLGVLCVQPSNSSADSTDCDDIDPTINPGAVELCNGDVDDDCNPGTVDDDSPTAPNWYVDGDLDGYGAGPGTVACVGPPFASLTDDDCNDGDFFINPGATDICNGGIDDDCDPFTLEDTGPAATTWYADVDGDGFGDPLVSTTACVQPSNFVANFDDCAPTDPLINPAAPDICNGGIDDDCDPLTDENTGGFGTLWYFDSDLDGHGDPLISLMQCLQPTGYVLDGDDCNDADPTINPSMPDICNLGIDDDCDPLTDEDVLSAITWYFDFDGDNWGSSLPTIDACEQPGGYAPADGDCNDINPAVNPGMLEICGDGLDNNCDLAVDEGCFLDHCGPVTGPEVWTSAVIHRITCDVDVGGPLSPTLIITDGAQVWVDDGFRVTVGLSSPGSIAIDGSATGVTFTSASAAPVAGSWSGLQLGANTVIANIDGLTLEYGGGNGFGGLYVTGASPVITNSLFQLNSNDGVYASSGAIDMTDTQISNNSLNGLYMAPAATFPTLGGPTFIGNTLTGNGAAPIYVAANYADQLDGPTNTFTGNALDNVYLHNGTVDHDATWLALDAPYELLGDLYVQGGVLPTLTLDDGVTVRFGPGMDFYVGWSDSGRLETLGGALGVTLTSNALFPAPGDWRGLWIETNDLGSSLTGLNVEYGGENTYGGLYVAGTTVTIDQSSFDNNQESGIYNAGATAIITNTSLSDNTNYGYYGNAASELSNAGVSGAFAGNTVTGNVRPMVLPALMGDRLDDSSTYAGNVVDSIELQADYVTQSGSWRALDADYFVSGDVYVEGPADPILTVEDGATVAFTSGVDLYSGWSDDGRVIVDGHTNGVLFTSSALVPAPGDWRGIYLSTSDQGSTFTGLTLEYAGANNLAGIYSGSPGLVTVTDSVLRNNTSGGFSGVGILDMSGTAVEDNFGDGVYLSAAGSLAAGLPATNTFQGNSLTGNTGYPVNIPANSVDELDPSTTYVGGNGQDWVALQADTISQDVTMKLLDADYVVTGDVYVENPGAPALVVEDGVVAHFGLGVDLYVGWSNPGTLDVQGVATGVVFTSAQPVPAPGDWNGLTLYQYSDGSSLVGLTVEYGGGTNGGIYLYATNVTMDNVTSQFNLNDGLYVDASVVDISNSNFSDNADLGIDATASSVVTGVAGCTFADNGGAALSMGANFGGNVSGGSYTGNGLDRVVLIADTVTDSQTWRDLGVPYRVIGDVYVQGPANPTLTVADDVTVEFGSGVDLYVGYTDNGALVVDGQVSGVTFTSDRVIKNPGDWRGVHFGANDLGSQVVGLQVEYGGANTYGNLYVATATNPFFDQVTSEFSSYDGMYVTGSTVDVTNSTFRNNNESGIYMTSTGRFDTFDGPNFTGNTLTNNVRAPIEMYVDTFDQLDASSSFSGNGDLIRILGGTVGRSGLWQELDEDVLVVADFYVQGVSNPQLTIEDGGVFFMNAGTEVHVGSSTDGSLIAAGDTNLGSGILFTSSAGVPARGDWDGLYLGPLSEGSRIRGTTIAYAGGGGNSGNIYLNANTDYEVTDCTLDQSAGHGLYSLTSSGLISDSTFTNSNNDGVYLDAGSSLTTVGTPSFVNNVITGNGGDAVHIYANDVRQLSPSSNYTGNGGRVRIQGGTATVSGTWLALDEDYVVGADTTIQGPSDPTITIADGVTILFEFATDLHTAPGDDGRLVVDGSGSGVTFTSAQVAPAAGDWNGVELGTYDFGSSLTGLTVEYGGSNSQANIYVLSSTVTLDNVVSTNSQTNGLLLSSATATVTDSFFDGNFDDGIRLTNGTLDMADTIVSNNLGHGVNGNTGSRLALDTQLVETFSGNLITLNGGMPLIIPVRYSGELEDTNSFAGNGNDRIRFLAGRLDIDSTWHQHDVMYQVEGNTSIEENGGSAHLIIEDGVRVEFDTLSEFRVGYSYPGTLEVQGNVLGVTFTSNKAVPAPGDWDGIYFGSLSDGSILTGLTLEYAGGNTLGGIYCYLTDVVMNNCTIRNNANHGVDVDNSIIEITNSTISGNTNDGVNADASSVLNNFAGNTFTGNAGNPMDIPANYAGEVFAGSTYSGNVDDRIVLLADTVTDSQRWEDHGVPYYLAGNLSIDGPFSPVLTISDGVIVQVGPSYYIRTGNGEPGTLVVEGAVTGVQFTSAQALPGPGDWDGLELYNFDGGSVLDGLTVEYAGSNALANIYSYLASATYTNVTVTDGSNHGIYLDGGASDISGSDISFNTDVGVFMTASARLANPALPERSFMNNTLTGNGFQSMRIPAESVGELDQSSNFVGNGGWLQITGGDASRTATWLPMDEEYEIAGDLDIEGTLNPTLTIEDGCVFNIAYNVDIDVGNSNTGTLIVNGGISGVTFTSNAAVKAPGQWEGLEFGSLSDASVIDGVTLEYGGENTLGNLYTYLADITITNTTSRYSQSDGLYAQSSSLFIQDSNFVNNTGDGVYIDASSSLSAADTPSFKNNLLTLNGGSPISLGANSVWQLDSTSSYAGNGLRVYIDGRDALNTGVWRNLDEDYEILADVDIDGPLAPVITIEDGTTLLMRSGVDFRVGNGAPGQLIVAGTALGGVTMTSTQVIPGPNDWAGLAIYASDMGSVFNNLTVEYAGSNALGNIYLYMSDVYMDGVVSQFSSNAGLYAQNARIEAINSSFNDNLGYGAFLDTNSRIDDFNEPSFTNNVLTGNSYPLYLYLPSLDQLDASSSFVGNTNDTIEIGGGDALTDGVWQALDAPYHALADLDIDGPLDPVVTIDPGVRMEFANNIDLRVGSGDDGGVLALGTLADPIVFTSDKAAPAPNDWGGILADTGCMDGTNEVIFDNVVVEYGGANGAGNFYLYSCDAQISNSTVTDSSLWGVYRTGTVVVPIGMTYANNFSGNLF